MSDEFELHKKLFLNYLRNERSLSENTITAYSFDIDKFFFYAENICLITEIHKITEETVTGFLGFVSRSGNKLDEKYSSRTVSRFISSLKSFFKYLVTDNLISVNPVENFTTLKSSRILPEVLSIEETELLLSAPDTKDKLGLRDKALMETMYASGLRVSETINLEISGIFFEEEYLRIFGKGSKERIVPIGRTALKFIQMYMNESRILLKNKNSYDYLFLNFRGSKLSRMGVLDIIRKHCSGAGINKNVHPHTLRHSFATHLLQGGADIRIIQEMLGHSDISTTQIYTHIDKDYLIEVHKTFHPRG
ncbi:MAG: site-specific tyrosine recombinase XerD [Bacteroidetes bacterium]|nr:site-specific tyrosine recombinase XerD [Bacteroidota bacterium]